MADCALSIAALVCGESVFVCSCCSRNDSSRVRVRGVMGASDCMTAIEQTPYAVQKLELETRCEFTEFWTCLFWKSRVSDGS